MLVLSRQRDQSLILTVPPDPRISALRELLSRPLITAEDLHQAREIVSATTERDKDAEVQMTIVDIRGDKVRLGSIAPLWIRVDREEVATQIGRNNAAAARARQTPQPLPATR